MRFQRCTRHFWIGFPDKVLRYNPTTQLETQINAPQLSNITTLICDQQQRVWIGTNEELFVWLDNENKLISLDQSDGAEDNEFLKRQYGPPHKVISTWEALTACCILMVIKAASPSLHLRN